MKIVSVLLLSLLVLSTQAFPGADRITQLLLNDGKQWTMTPGSESPGGCCKTYTFLQDGRVQAGDCPPGNAENHWTLSQQDSKNIITIGSHSYELQFVEVNGEKHMILRALRINEKGRYHESTFK